MSGVTQATFMNQRSFTLPLPAQYGDAFGGGFFAGQISTNADGIATHNLIVSPRSSGNASKQWKNALTATSGADSDIDGVQNTADMVADGNSTVYPAAHFCNDLTVGGFSDWYMPAKNELEVCYYHLKPDTTLNNTSSGINPNAVPARSSNYTTGSPAQTSATAFIVSTGAERFNTGSYWSSTESSATNAIFQYFYTGNQNYTGTTKINSANVRAIRKATV